MYMLLVYVMYEFLNKCFLAGPYMDMGGGIHKYNRCRLTYIQPITNDHDHIMIADIIMDMIYE